jgi:hypothetical protein
MGFIFIFPESLDLCFHFLLLHQLTKWYKVVLEDKACFPIEENITRWFIQDPVSILVEQQRKAVPLSYL